MSFAEMRWLLVIAAVVGSLVGIALAVLVLGVATPAGGLVDSCPVSRIVVASRADPSPYSPEPGTTNQNGVTNEAKVGD